MNAGISRNCVLISLILNVISFILSLIAFYIPYWKFIQLRSTFSLSMLTIDENEVDPLIRGELEKYTELLYRRGKRFIIRLFVLSSHHLILISGDQHRFGLIPHCILNNDCGTNRLLTYSDENYEYCHNVKSHHECIFSDSISSTSFSEKCLCQKPFYMKLSSILLIFIIVLQGLFLFSNFLRLCRRQFYFYKDLPLRILNIVIHFFICLFLLIILIEQNRNRLREPLEFFQSMHRHYSRIQIYSFANNLELILKQLEQDFHVHFGPSYICLIIILIATSIAFITSTLVEIKLPSEFEQETKTTFPTNRNYPLPRIKRFPPDDDSQYPRQTKV